MATQESNASSNVPTQVLPIPPSVFNDVPPRQQLPPDILHQFSAAVEEDDLESFTNLLDKHFPDRSRDLPGDYRIYELNPVACEAASNDRAVMVAALLEYPFRRLGFMATAAVDAKANNSLSALLDKGWDINEVRGATGLTLLAYTVPNREMTLWLIDHGADPNQRPVIDTTAMSMAALRAPTSLIRELLDNYGGDIHRGQLLHFALERESTTGDIIEVLGLLLERGAVLNRTMYADDAASLNMYCFVDHGTPLHKAAAKGNVEIVQYLLSQGADTSILSSKGKTALAWAEAAGHDDVAAILQSPDQNELSS